MPSHVAVVRPPGGKTVEAEVVVGEDCVVASARLAGDFFLYPEEALEEAERLVAGCGDEECIRARILEALRDAVLVGASAADLAEALVEAYRGACRPWTAGRRL